MSMNSLEKAILEELQEVTKNKKLKLKNIMEWSTGEVKAQEGEKLIQLPALQINVAYKESPQPAKD